MRQGPDGRKQVDLFALPRWAQLVIVAATIAIVVGVALVVGPSDPGPAGPISAVVAALVAFAVVAWRMQRR
jgi:MYXO-CTERM domain-containing protein